MKKINYIIVTSILFLTNIFTNDAVLQPKKDNYSNRTNQNGKINLSVESQADIKGIQFDILYNSQEIRLIENKILSKIPNVDIYTKIKDDGIATILMFSMRGDKILDAKVDNIAEVIEINFEPMDMFYGPSQVELINIILASSFGEQINSQTSSIFDITYFAPLRTSLSKNYPNPFNPSTTIDYQLAKPAYTSLVVYDLNGFEVKILVQAYQEAAYYSVVWDGNNHNNQQVENGRYLLKMISAGYSETITMTILK